ncbi:MAG TPA: carboxymuconolactone decarboxylase family protein [Methanosarcinaceae archaeon]|nr:carboxymuconolactone decarboxylase family protein [Methanosarcinaceae archaeon]
MELKKMMNVLDNKPEDAVSQLLDDVRDRYGEIPYILNFMKDMPELLIPKILYDDSIMREFKRMDSKTVELISIGVSAALRCDHCLKMHIRIANRLGITKEEIFDAILIGGTLSNASVLADGTRALDSEFSSGEDTGETCGVCDLSSID